MVASKMFVSVQRNTLTKQETPATPVNINKFNVSKWLGDASWNPIKSTSSKNYYYELHDSPCESNNGNRSIKDNLINSQRLYRGDSFSESKCASPDNDSFAMFTEDRPVPVGMNIVDKENIFNQSTYPMEKNPEKSTVRASDTENQVKCFHSKPKNHAVIQTTHSKVANPPKTSDLLNSQPSFFHAKTMHSHDQISIPELHKDDDKIIGQKVAKVNAGSFYLHAKHSECYKSHLYHVRKETPEERSEILPKLLPIQENATRQNKYRIWKTSIDPKSGQMYYYDLITRQTQWDKPLELVSKQEKRAIRLKDVSQRDFFANMEANILQSFQMGQIPGTSNCIPKNIEKNKSFSKTYLHNPNLVNTISSMDETNLLRELDKVKVCIRNAKLSQQVQQVDKRFVLLNKQVPNKTTRNKSISFEYSSTNKKLKDVAKPVLTKNSTCGTMYVGPTMSAPDIDATINCVCALYREHLLRSARTYSCMERSHHDCAKYDIFNDQLSDRRHGDYVHIQSNPRDSRRRSISPIGTYILEEYMERNADYEIGVEALALETVELIVPSLDEITNFYCHIFRRSQMEVDCIIISLIYVERIMNKTNGNLVPNIKNWQSLLFSCMILASKVWDDLSMWNADFSRTSPVGAYFPLKRINELEVAVLSCLNYSVDVLASEYAKYYFLLRSMMI